MVFNLCKCEYMSFGKPMEKKYMHIMKPNVKKCYWEPTQTLSSVDNLAIILLFGCLLPLGFTEKSTNYMRGLYDCVEMSTP